MVAKGHDFPNVTFVGIISADSSLNFPDSAAERTFQLISQVAGFGPAKNQEGTIQALEPNQCYSGALTYDFDSFFDEEYQTVKTFIIRPSASLHLFELKPSQSPMRWARLWRKPSKTLNQPIQALSRTSTRADYDSSRFFGCKSLKPQSERIYANFGRMKPSGMVESKWWWISIQ